jgi:hypothetical protein
MNAKFKYFPLILVILIITSSCSTVDKDCICTEVFMTSTVMIIDSNGVPVDSLSVTVKDKDGNKLNIEQDFFQFVPGRYIGLNDGFLNLLCGKLLPQKFFFSATDGSKTISAEYLYHTDDCCCHINKVEGPDTLVLR